MNQYLVDGNVQRKDYGGFLLKKIIQQKLLKILKEIVDIFMILIWIKF